MYWLNLVCGILAMVGGGYLIGDRMAEYRFQPIIEKERRYYMKMLKSEYERGYRDGFMAKVTPNEIRKVLGLPPMEESDYVHTKQRLEDTEEAT